MKTNKLVLIGILIIAFAAMIAPVMADTTTITGNPQKAISITVHNGISNWVLIPSTDNADTSSVTLDVTSNEPAWSVSVKDALDGAKPAGSEGKMVDYLTTGPGPYGTLALGSAMKVQGDTTQPTKFTGTEKTLSGSDQAIDAGLDTTASAGQFLGTPLKFTQTVSATDPVLLTNHVYRIVITFTGATN